ncbi:MULTISPECIES: argininosuccinate lyase [unclassified Streptococcus]|uniref:argininosuccinate lyase n=1 Tax=unclassified Streptococcus TaxID=2608887 RepID=UPI00359CE2F8
MELVLPNNYVALEQEEMMYTDGGGFGKHWWNSRGAVGLAIDGIATLIPILGAYHGMRAVGTLAKQGRVYIRTNIDKALRQARVGFATAIVGGIVDALFLVYGGSVGSWIAAAADYADRWAGSYGYDGYILA